MDEGRVAGQLWVGICRKWWTNFSAMCVFAWQTPWFTWGDLKQLRELVLQWVMPIYSSSGGNFVVPLVDRPHVFFSSYFFAR